MRGGAGPTAGPVPLTTSTATLLDLQLRYVRRPLGGGLAGGGAVLRLRAVGSDGDFDACVRYRLAHEDQRVDQDTYALIT